MVVARHALLQHVVPRAVHVVALVVLRGLVALRAYTVVGMVGQRVKQLAEKRGSCGKPLAQCCNLHHGTDTEV